jgi:16S rRNA (guanine(966)-N(2))-methyltransferase RsmD
MRIISGTSKGRKLATPKGSSVRPTSDRVKESIFNILRGEVEGKVVLDLFAGTGNLGIEALSRGAKKTTFVEKGWRGLRLIRQNLLQCGMMERAEIIPKDAIRSIGLLSQKGRAFDLILMDPPYEKGLIQRILNKLRDRPIYRENSILVVEHGRREPLPEHLWGWELIRQRQIGDTMISFLIPRPEKALDEKLKENS